MRAYSNLGTEAVIVPIPVSPALFSKPLKELLKLKKDVKQHAVQPQALLAYDETEPNGTVITSFCEELGMEPDAEI